MAVAVKESGSRQVHVGIPLLYIALSLGAFLMALPLLMMLLTSFKTPAEAMRIPPVIIPAHPSLAAYSTVLTQAPFFTWFRNSVIVSVSVTALILFTSSIAGYVFAKFSFPGRNVLFILLLTTLMVPFPVVLVPIYLIVSKLHLLNSLLALIVPSMVSAFGIFLMRQFVAAIPDDLIDAARLDGASEWTIYWQLIRPQLGPAMATLGIFTFMSSWNDYLWPLVAINDQDKMTLPLALSFFNTAHSTRYDLVMAASVMVILPIIVVFIFFQRHFINAMVLSGVKG
ncbi:MAG TPA: carbohydrate ABC transporter permease [Roseiflexaceae bacterium]|nr:carbohydrate ABC transporter permease [Roseiflexaceae bacterium]